MSSPQADLAALIQSGPNRIGLGTYTLGSDTISVCLRALELGYRHIDTATLYRNEESVAEAIQAIRFRPTGSIRHHQSAGPGCRSSKNSPSR